MTRLERWIAQAIADRPDPGQQQLLHRYAIWHVVQRLRSRLRGAQATYSQAVAARRNIKAATVLLDWLTARGLTWPPPGKPTWKHGCPASTKPTAPTPEISSAGPESTS
jgi:hypothetical protein